MTTETQQFQTIDEVMAALAAQKYVADRSLATTQAVRVFGVIERHRDLKFKLLPAPFGASAYFSHGHAFPEETKVLCDSVDAILKGPAGLGHIETQKIPVDERPDRKQPLPLGEFEFHRIPKSP